MKGRLPKREDFPEGTEFVIKEFDVPLVHIPQVIVIQRGVVPQIIHRAQVAVYIRLLWRQPDPLSDLLRLRSWVIA